MKSIRGMGGIYNRVIGPISQLKELSTYLQGMADATQNEKLADAAEWLEKASDNICAQGYFGCEGGATCTSDHK